MAVEIFNDGSNVELLALELGGPREVDPEKVQEESEQKARERVDSDKRWVSMSALAERQIAEGLAHWRELEVQKESLKERVFHEWYGRAREEYAGGLRTANNQFNELADGILAAFPGAVMDLPLTSVDAVNLSTQKTLLSEVTPTQAGIIIRDGLHRKDMALLDLSRFLLASWPEYRNAWATPEARQLAFDLLKEIDTATPDMDRLMGVYAREQVEGYRITWRHLLNHISNGDGVIDPVHRQVGALAPLLEPLEK